jgi:NADH dehydrogenase
MTERHPGKLVTIFGGSGFIGRYLVQDLARRGWRIRVAVRRPDLAGHLRPLGKVGQIQPVQANVRYPDSLAAAVQHADAVVNLVGILAASGRQTFQAVQAAGPRTVAEAARAAGVARFVQMSAIGADPNSRSDYGRSKAEGEQVVRETFADAVIVRPSIVFGAEDQFFNRFAGMAKLTPVLPLVGADTRFQPVFVGDVADFLAEAVDGKVAGGTIYELGGPDVKTFRELIELMLEEIRRKRLILALPFWLAGLQARMLSVLPSPPLTTDQVRLLRHDNVVSEAAIRERRTFAAAAITPHSLAAILPTYLWRYRPGGQFALPQA